MIECPSDRGLNMGPTAHSFFMVLSQAKHSEALKTNLHGELFQISPFKFCEVERDVIVSV